VRGAPPLARCHKDPIAIQWFSDHLTTVAQASPLFAYPPRSLHLHEPRTQLYRTSCPSMDIGSHAQKDSGVEREGGPPCTPWGIGRITRIPGRHRFANCSQDVPRRVRCLVCVQVQRPVKTLCLPDACDQTSTFGVRVIFLDAVTRGVTLQTGDYFLKKSWTLPLAHGS